MIKAFGAPIDDADAKIIANISPVTTDNDCGAPAAPTP